MPALYAHRRFAREVMPCLGRRLEGKEALYFAGSQGPDPLFYYNPFMKNPVTDLGSLAHSLSGREFFTAVCARLGKEPAQARMAYLWGLLTHYCLDSFCHPYVNGLADGGICNHTELETEFDRMLLTMDGIRHPHWKDLGAKLRLTEDECAIAADCFPPMTGRQYSRCLRNMRLSTRILSGKTVLRRELLEKALPHFGSNVRYQLMTKGPNPRVARKTAKLLERYCRAREQFPELLKQLEDHLRQGTPLGDDFAPDFG